MRRTQRLVSKSGAIFARIMALFIRTCIIKATEYHIRTYYMEMMKPIIQTQQKDLRTRSFDMFAQQIWIDVGRRNHGSLGQTLSLASNGN